MDSTLHPTFQLFNLQKQFFDYPLQVIPVPEMTLSKSFFPAGTGLWLQQKEKFPPKFPLKGIMVLGNNWGRDDEYDFLKQAISWGEDGEVTNSNTWKYMLELFKEAKVPLRECFFTNFYLGLLKN